MNSCHVAVVLEGGELKPFVLLQKSLDDSLLSQISEPPILNEKNFLAKYTAVTSLIHTCFIYTPEFIVFNSWPSGHIKLVSCRSVSKKRVLENELILDNF